ncbi:MAG: MATE family efflux transporter [Gemmatimonadales bacterium]
MSLAWPARRDLAALWRLAAPIIVIQVGMMLMGVIDTLMVGRVSAEALAAVAIGNLVFFIVAIAAQGILMVLDPLVAQAVGAADVEGITLGVQRGLLLSVILSIPLMAAMLPAGPLLTLLRQPPDVIPLAAGYIVRMIPGALPFLVFVVLRQSLQAMHHTETIVWSIVLSNLANAALNWVLIFGHLGFPAMGVNGSAWATTASRLLMAGLLLWLGWPYLRRYLRPMHPRSLAPGPLWRMVAVGAPIGGQFFLEFGAFGMIALLMGLLGTVQVAGHQIAINLASLTFMVPVGISAAAAVLVGNAVGRGDGPGARRATWAAILSGGGFMVTTAALFLGFPSFLAGLYTPDARVLSIAIGLIPIAGVFQVFDGLQAVGGGVLRGLGDTRAPMVINVLGFWMVGMPVSVYLGFEAGLGPRGLWWGFVAGLGTVAMFLMLRIRQRLLRGIARLQVEQPEPVRLAE